MVAKSNASTKLAQDVKNIVDYVNATEALDASKAREALQRRLDTDDWKYVSTMVKARFVYLAAIKTNKAYTEARALSCVNGELAGNSSKKPDDVKRTAQEDVWETTARSNLRHLLGRLGVKSKDGHAGNENAKRTPSAVADAAAPDAPIALSALTVPHTKTAADLDTVFGLLAAWVGKLQNQNAANFTGDKGAAYRDLASHLQNEVKRIAAIND